MSPQLCGLPVRLLVDGNYTSQTVIQNTHGNIKLIESICLALGIKNIKHHQDFSLKVSLDHWHVRPVATHKSRLPFLLGTRVFFVFYWHSVKILRKNGKVAEPVRGGRPGPGGARLLAQAGAACAGPAVTCCMAPAGPALARAPEIRARLPSVRPPPGPSSALARSGLPGLVKGTVQSQRKRETMNTVGFL